MALNKAIKHGKEHRQPYRLSKIFDPTCRNSGACGYCRNSRIYQTRKAIDSAKSRSSEMVATVEGYSSLPRRTLLKEASQLRIARRRIIEHRRKALERVFGEREVKPVGGEVAEFL